MSKFKAVHLGDDGYTYDAAGRRLAKDSDLVEFEGEIDELISIIGVARSMLLGKPGLEDLYRHLGEVQRKLMDIASHVASAGRTKGASAEDVEALETLIDEYWGKLPPLRGFVVPGPPLESALLHYARAVCRRVERRAAKLLREGAIDRESYRYLNRLSDLLFVYARFTATTLGGYEEHR